MASLNHIGVFVRSIDAAAAIYEGLGLSIDRVITGVTHQGRTVRIAFLPIADGVTLELIESPERLDEGVEPLNHICFEVLDIESELSRLRRAGVPLADERPRPGMAAPLVAFLKPEAADGVRIELAQH